MKSIMLLIFTVIFLAGCSQETMIHLSEENKLIMESKINEKEEKNSDEVLASVDEEESQSSVEETSEESELQEEESVLMSEEEADQDEFILDTSQWPVYEGNESFNLTDFLPITAYQIKSFDNGQGLRINYPNYVDNSNQLMQVESRYNGQTEVTIYNWGTSQLVRLATLTDVNPFINHMQNSAIQANSESYDLILQSPLTVGSQWQRNTNQRSEITEIYASVQFPAGEFENVIEVTSQGNNTDYKEYFAQGQGLVAFTSDQGQWQVVENYPDSRIINSIQVSLPSQDGKQTLEERSVNFKWQTNSSFASAFDELLKEEGILDESISVQDLSLNDGVVTIDFTPGVVAVLNQNAASEQTVMASIIISLADFFDVDQVRLSVNGNGMLANTVPYPTNGIYQVEEVRGWLDSSNQEERPAEENTESTIELSLESN